MGHPDTSNPGATQNPCMEPSVGSAQHMVCSLAPTYGMQLWRLLTDEFIMRTLVCGVFLGVQARKNINRRVHVVLDMLLLPWLHNQSSWCDVDQNVILVVMCVLDVGIAWNLKLVMARGLVHWCAGMGPTHCKLAGRCSQHGVSLSRCIPPPSPFA